MANKVPDGVKPDGSPVPNPRKRSSSEFYISSSVAAGCGDTQSAERMSNPFRDGFAPNDETGEGKG
jgi:hypothetical protein